MGTPTEHAPETEKLSQSSNLLRFEALSGEILDHLGHLGVPPKTIQWLRFDERTRSKWLGSVKRIAAKVRCESKAIFKLNRVKVRSPPQRGTSAKVRPVPISLKKSS
jgi:hypothetical protein